MPKNTNNKIKSWNKISKDFCQLLVPNRPSQDDCKNYGLLVAEVLKNKKQPKIMLMGSTSELRRILYTYEYLQNAEVSCVDINPTMYRAMTDFIVKGKHYKEKYYKYSWLKTKFPDRYFDLVMGDEVICQIEPQKHHDLLREVSRVLKNHGTWITRIDHYISETLEKLNVKNILLNLAEKINRGEYDFQKAMNLLFIWMFYCEGSVNYSETSTIGHLRIIKKGYNQNLKNHKYNKIIKELIDLYEDNFVPMAGDYNWYVLSERESKQELKDFFEIKKKIYSSDHPATRYSPIYLLKKK